MEKMDKVVLAVQAVTALVCIGFIIFISSGFNRLDASLSRTAALLEERANLLNTISEKLINFSSALQEQVDQTVSGYENVTVHDADLAEPQQQAVEKTNSVTVKHFVNESNIDE